MDSRPDSRWLRASQYAATTLSCGLWFVTLGTAPDAILAWLAPIPMFWLGHSVRARTVFVVAFLVHAVGAASLWPYLHGVIGTPIRIVAVALVGPALLFAMTAALLRVLHREVGSWLAAVGTGACAAAFDLLRFSFSPHGSFLSLAYTQVPFPHVTQIAAMGGTPAIVFAMTTVAAATATAVAPAIEARARTASVALALGLLGTTLLGGALRLRGTAGADGQLRVVLLAADAPRSPPLASTPAGRALVDRYDQAVRDLPVGAQDVVVLPERIVDLDTDASRVEWMTLWAARARQLGLTIVTGAATTRVAAARNTAFLASPGEAVPAQYFKQHLLPPFELVFTPGTDLVVRSVSEQQRAGVMICKDADFPALSRRYANAGVTALLVPAWDFGVDGPLHARMAMLRGVEGGFAVVRSARSGLLTVSDAYGRVHASRATSAAPLTMLRATVPLRRLRTVYAQLGDAFGGACLVLTVGLAGLVAVRARQRSNPSRRPFR